MKINFEKGDGLVPVIIQNNLNLQVLMLGYMNEAAFVQTKKEGRVTFFSRSKNRLWTKGESSGNYLEVVDIKLDCDEDTILIKVNPSGPVCHTGSKTCFKENTAKGFLYNLQSTIKQRISSEDEKSYTYQLFQKGINKVAQKVGEEAVELIIEAKDDDDQLFKDEAADLMYHFLILLRAKGMKIEDVEEVLLARQG